MMTNIILFNRKKLLSFTLLLILFRTVSFAQSTLFDTPLLTFDRGKLWHSLYMGKSGPGSFNNWAKTGTGWDWPGFDESRINEDIGGSPSYLASGGFYIGCKSTKDSVLGFEDWAMYSGSISNEPTAKYIIKKHKKYNDNHGVMKYKNRGEEVIETVWEYNPNFPNTYLPERQLPLRVSRTAHQWNGSMRDENYIIYEYVIKNISPELIAYKEIRRVQDTLKDFYLMFSYAIHSNSRSWKIFYPQFSPGARNTRFTVDTLKNDFHTGKPRKMILGWAGNYKDPETGNQVTTNYGQSAGYGMKYTDSKGNSITGEWLAPGFAGIRLLYSSPDKTSKQATKINKTGWSAVENNQDLAGPITGKTGVIESSYEVLRNPANAFNYIESESNTMMGQRRVWSMMSLGPWDLLPGDSIVIAIAEIVDGIDYLKATGPQMYPFASATTVGTVGRDMFERSADKAQFTYDNNFNHPDPPVAPYFKVDFYKSNENFVANQITWSDSTDNFADPDDNIQDLIGYRLYRSEYLPIGPWIKVGDIPKKDINYYSGGLYKFIDSTVAIGTSYYYSLTAYDSGRTSWNIKPAAKFKETNTNKVPPLESSIYANRTNIPFVATLQSSKNLDNVIVVPNPFIIGEGSSQPGSKDIIQFVNIPNPCTIRIFSVRGDLIKVLKAGENSGSILSWDQATDYGQFVQSGVYVYHLDSPLGKKTGKFAIIR